MLFKKLVKQHRVHLIVAHAVRSSFLVAQHQVSLDSFYFFGNESEAGRTTRLDLWLIAEAHRIELVYDFAGMLHRLDFILETPRRNQSAKLTICIYIDGLRTARLPENVADVATVIHVRTV